MKNYRVGTLLFPEFELLDVFGPLEMLGMYPDQFTLEMVGLDGDRAASAQGPVTILDTTISNNPDYDIILIPGGRGTRREVNNLLLLRWLQAQQVSAGWITSVCTGSVLLAAAGILDGRRATTNKNAFGWVEGFGTGVNWVKKARWVEDGNIFTSSGVSAGIDMTLALISKILGESEARQAAHSAEYIWNEDPDNDPFAK